MNLSVDNIKAKPLVAIILAAGKGTRMQSELPKVLHPVNGKPMLQWVVDAVRTANANRIILVVGHGSEEVKINFSDCEYAIQEPQLGTGHAAMCCKEQLQNFHGDILVLGGDGPLIQASTITAMMKMHRTSNAAATLATSIIQNPTGYGRIVRDENNNFEAIVEHKNATAEQLKIREIYPSYAVFQSNLLFECLDNLQPNPLTKEYYLTEVPRMLKERGEQIEIVNSVNPSDTLSINTPEQLKEVEAILTARLETEAEQPL